MSLSSLKKNSTAALDKLKQTVENERSNKKQTDERFWRPTFDRESGVGSAVIRFMPAVEGEDLPWVKLIRHAFKGPTGKWYIANSPRTLNQSCPVAQLNARLWNSGVESDKNIARAQKQKIEYITNVYIVKDPANPENEGQVRLYKFGPMIFEMIQNAMFPKFEGDSAVDPFNPWHGANFNIRMVAKKVNDDIVPNYEKSTFSSPSAMFDGDDDKIEAVYAKCYSLQDFISADKFDSEETLKRRLVEVLGQHIGSGIEVVEGYSSPVKAASAPENRSVPPQTNDFADEPLPEVKVESASTSDDEDDDEAFLRKLMAS